MSFLLESSSKEEWWSRGEETEVIWGELGWLPVLLTKGTSIILCHCTEE